MSTVLSSFCPICKNPYDGTDKRPFLGTCLHNVCNSCLKSSGITKCPICDKENAFKITELSEKPAFAASEMYNRIILKFKREAINFEAATKPDRFDWILEQFRLSQQKAVDIHSVPELAQAKEKSVEMARKVIDRIEKVQERQLWMKKEELEQFAKMDLASESPEPEKFIGEITSLFNQFNSYKITNLTNSEADGIDQKVDKKMTEAVQKLGLPEDTPQKFLFYKSLCNILQDASENMEKMKKQSLEEMTRFEDFFASRMKKLEKIINKETEEAKLTLRLFLFEVTENSFVIDRLLLKSMEAICDFCKAQLLWSRYFPETLNAKSEEYAYNMMLEKKFGIKDQNFLNSIFSWPLSG